MAVRNKTQFIANEIYFITFTILGWKHVFTGNERRWLHALRGAEMQAMVRN